MKNYRFSSYSIPVKLEHEEDKYMLIHGYTGAIDVVSEKVIAYLNNFGQQQPGSTQVSEATLDALKARGYLTNKTQEEEVEYVRKLANLLHQKDKILHKNFVFLVAYDCNFRCPYCYENEILKDSRQWSKKVFTKEMVDKAYDALLKIGENKKLHSSQITLYGGEPLLAQNKDIVTYIVDKGANLGYNFVAITNGYDLDAFKELLAPNKINRLQITIDGMKGKHDKRRVHFQTKTSFDKIVTNIGIALKQDVFISIRVNTNADNFDELNRIDQLFKDLGYYEKGKLQIYSAILFNYNYSQTKKSGFFRQEEYNKRHKEISYKYMCTVSGMARILHQVMKNKGRVNFSSTFCTAQIGSFIFDPFGDIYNCWENVGKMENIIGHYSGNCIEWTEMKNIWHRQNIAVSSDCIQCKYAFFCRGGCIIQGIYRTRKFGQGFCNDYSDTFHNSVNLAYNKILDDG